MMADLMENGVENVWEDLWSSDPPSIMLRKTEVNQLSRIVTRCDSWLHDQPVLATRYFA
jgi:hypothetical protein